MLKTEEQRVETSALPDVPEMNRPLSIRVTDAGGMVVKWHNLLRRCLPLIENPEAFSAVDRKRMVREIEAALEPPSQEDEPEEAYEPGSWLDEALDREEREVEREALWN